MRQIDNMTPEEIGVLKLKGMLPDKAHVREVTKIEVLRLQIMKMLHPLVSPYDLSDHSLKMQMYNNPGFRNAVERITDFIENKSHDI